MADEIRTVYDKDGTAHQMTYPNARDMVTHCGWRWNLVNVDGKPAVTVTPLQPTTTDEVVTVYDTEGYPHLMTWSNARDMIKNAGWTRENVVKTEPAAVVEEKKAEEPAPVTAIETPPATTAEAPVVVAVTAIQTPPAAAALPDFDALTAKEIEAWARETLSLELDGRWSKARMIGAIREKIA